MEKKTRSRMLWAAMLGGMGVAGYMYMKKNPKGMENAMTEVKKMTKDMAKKTYDALDEYE